MAERLYLKRRYILALSLVALLVLSAAFIRHGILDRQEQDANIINLSGMQRMLSQKVSLQLHRLSIEKTPNSLAILEDALNTFQTNHQYLTSSQVANSSAVKRLYFAGQPSLNEKVIRLIGCVQREIEINTFDQAACISEKDNERLLFQLNTVVQQFEIEANQRVSLMNKAEWLIVFMTLLLLVIEARFIFQPMERAIRKYITQLQDYIITIEKLDEEKLEMEMLANHDHLTGLLSLHAVEKYLHTLLQKCQAKQHKFALLYIDLDNFKQINDKLGHLAGDAALKAAADKISGLLRNTDFASRIGGDEFIVALDQINSVEILNDLCIRLVASFASPVTIENEEIVLSASIGAALYPDHASTIDRLRLQADAAMYRAKEKGKSTYCIYDSEQDYSVLAG